MKLALVQMNSGLGRDENVEHACHYIDSAVSTHKPDLVVIPEFFNTVYFAQYRDYKHIDLAEREDGYSITRLREKARQHRIHLVATIFEEDGAGVYYDTAIVLAPDGGTIGKYRKTHPAAVQSLEKIYFRYGSHFPVVTIGEWRVGFIICYDTFFPESARCAALNGAELIVVPFASPAQVLWRDLMRSRAFENGVYFAPCNKVGKEGEWIFGGASMIVSPRGEVLVEAGSTDDEIIAATIDREEVFAARRRYPMFRDRRPELYRAISSPTEDLPSPGHGGRG